LLDTRYRNHRPKCCDNSKSMRSRKFIRFEILSTFNVKIKNEALASIGKKLRVLENFQRYRVTHKR